MDKAYDVLLQKRENIIKSLLNQEEFSYIKNNLDTIKKIHETEKIDDSAKLFYQSGNTTLFIDNNIEFAKIDYDLSLSFLIDDIFYLANKYHIDNNIEKAISLYTQLIDLKDKRAHFHLGNIYLFNEQYKDIKKGLYYHNLEINNKNYNSHISLYTYFYLQNDKANANKHLQEILYLNENKYLLPLLEKAYEINDLELVSTIYNRLDSTDSFPGLSIIDICYKNNIDPQKYIDYVLQSNDESMHKGLLNIYLNNSKFEEAENFINNNKVLTKEIISNIYFDKGYINKKLEYIDYLFNTKDYMSLIYDVSECLGSKYAKEFMSIASKLENIILNERKDYLSDLIERYLLSDFIDRANQLFDKTIDSEDYEYKVSLFKTFIYLKDIKRAQLTYNKIKITSNNNYFQIINLINSCLSLELVDYALPLKNIIIDSKDNYFIAMLASPYLKYHYDKEALEITKSLLQLYSYCYEDFYDYEFIFKLVESYLESDRIDELHDITLYIMKTSNDKFKLEKLYIEYDYEEEFNKILKEAD